MDTKACDAKPGNLLVFKGTTPTRSLQGTARVSELGFCPVSLQVCSAGTTPVFTWSLLCRASFLEAFGAASPMVCTHFNEIFLFSPPLSMNFPSSPLHTHRSNPSHASYIPITAAPSRAVWSTRGQRRRQRYSLGSPVPGRVGLDVPLDGLAARQEGTGAEQEALEKPSTGNTHGGMQHSG